jgi:hypothetical protein
VRSAAGACRLWQARQLLSGQGWLEDLEFDGRGGITISGLAKGRIGDTVPVTSNGTIVRLNLQTGRRSTWARGLTMPNALVFLAEYIAGFASDKIYRLGPRTHRSCAIATGLGQPTSVRFGAVGWHPGDLYVTDASGHLAS